MDKNEGIRPVAVLVDPDIPEKGWRLETPLETRRRIGHLSLIQTLPDNVFLHPTAREEPPDIVA